MQKSFIQCGNNYAKQQLCKCKDICMTGTALVYCMEVHDMIVSENVASVKK